VDDYRARAGRAYWAFQAARGDLYNKAQVAAAEAAQRFSAEMFAATGGDDAWARASAAWLRYQADMATASHEYWRGLRGQQRELATTLDDVQNEAANAAYEQHLDALKGLGGTAGAAGQAGSERPAQPPEGPQRGRRSSS